MPKAPIQRIHQSRKQDAITRFQSGTDIHIIARDLKLTIKQVREIVGLPDLDHPMPGDKESQGKDPTPSQIAAACKAIQKTWSPEERNRRRVGPSYEEMMTITALRPHGRGRSKRS